MFLVHRLAVLDRMHGVIMQGGSIEIFNDICPVPVTAVTGDR